MITLLLEGSSSEAVNFVSTGAAMIVRMRGLPYDCSEQQIVLGSCGPFVCREFGGGLWFWIGDVNSEE
ncbi:hypothetical protein NECAME_06253 [Necator americanus]|uniref:Uncharacterized protein n=1 Tax=Necator americanus TaxID=51031 RepID=W2TUG2_NECAM|nr:hypothetical protein NECAME_06253 [Necator americanus]ETN85740.1 hypothetical protein NECAME_06253 [Necator americanus]